MPPRTSYTRGRTSVSGAADEDESSLQMSLRYGYDLVQFLAGLTLAVIGGIKGGETWEGGTAWPIVRDSYLTAPRNGHGSGEVRNATYNVHWVVMVAGLCHCAIALSSAGVRYFSKNIPDTKIPYLGGTVSRITDMLDTAGYHGITDALLGWAVYKHLGVAHTWLLYSLVAVHFLSFYIIGLLQTQATDVLKPGDVIRHTFANLPAVMGLLVWEGYILWQSWIWINEDGSGNADMSAAVKAVAPVYFFLSVSGVFGMGSNYTDATINEWCCGCLRKVFGVRFTFTRIVSATLRLYVALVLLTSNGHLKAWVVHDQANYV